MSIINDKRTELLSRRSDVENNNKTRRNDVRDPFDRDEGRLIHSAAFRRLQSKTQVLGLGESDFYRTRLTHSMEVAQIGRGIVSVLKNNPKEEEYVKHLPSTSLITTICLAHDIGHPPFGHGGEVALNYCMRDYGGFEGNAQTLRILSKVDKYSEKYGLDPTRRTLLGVLKYPCSYSELVNNDFYNQDQDVKDTPYWLIKDKTQKPPKCYYDSDKDVVDFIFEAFKEEDVKKFKKFKISNDNDDVIKHNETRFKSLDASIMDLADNISYSLHDFEDALSLKMITKDVWEQHFKGKENLFDDLKKNDKFDYDFKKITELLFTSSVSKRKDAIGELVNLMITNVSIENNNSGCEDPQLSLQVKLDEDIENLRKHIYDIVYNEVIRDTNVQLLEFKGQKLIIELFQVIAKDPERLLPKTTKEKWEEAGKDCDSQLKETKQHRVICDYISGMTDEHAIKLYEKLFTPNKGSVFDRL